MHFINVVEDFENRICVQIDERLALGQSYNEIASDLKFNPNVLQTVLQALADKDYLTPLQNALLDHVTGRLDAGEILEAICGGVRLAEDVVRLAHQILRRRRETDQANPPMKEADLFYVGASKAAYNSDNDRLFKKGRNKNTRGGDVYRDHFARANAELAAKDNQR